MRLISVVRVSFLLVVQPARASDAHDGLGLATGPPGATDGRAGDAATSESLSGMIGIEPENEDKKWSSLRGRRGMMERLFDSPDSTELDESLATNKYDTKDPDTVSGQQLKAPRYPKLVSPPVNVTVVDGEYIVVLEESVTDVEVKMKALLRVVNQLRPGNDAEGFGSLWNINDSFKGQAVKMTHEQAEIMSELDGIKFIERNIELVDHSRLRGETSGEFNRVSNCFPSPGNRIPWNLDLIDQKVTKPNRKYEPEKNGEGVLAIILDDGVRGTHEEFKGDGGKSRVASTGADVPRFQSSCTANEDVGHGTFVAAIVGGNISGVAKKVNLVNIRKESCPEKKSDRDKLNHYIDVIDFIAGRHRNGGIVVNGSLQFKVNDVQDALKNAIKGMIAKNIVFVVEAGDLRHRTGANRCTYFPANLEETITVGATEFNSKTESVGFFEKTNLGCVDIFAPGADIISACKDSDSGYMTGTEDGTSYAAAHVTGAVALILEESPKLSSADVKKELIARATRNKIQNIPETPATPNMHLFVNKVRQ